MHDRRKDLIQCVSPCVLRSREKDGFTYHIEELIGRGGSSLVYRAYYEQNGFHKYVLIKELYPYDLGNKGLLDRRESGEIFIVPSETREKAASRFAFYYNIARNEQDSINILKTNISEKSNEPYFFDQIDCFEQNNTIYSVLSTEVGDTLLQLLYKGEVEGLRTGIEDLSDVAQTILRILEALRPIHERGMLHLDISPDNIYFSQMAVNGHRIARLIDFNSIFDLNAMHEQKKSFSYKEGYSAIELSKISEVSRNVLNYSTDLFSVAAVMFRIITGKLITDYPMHRFSSWKVDEKNSFCRNASESAIKLCNKILYKGLSLSQGNRYSSIDEMKTDLDELYSLCIQNPYVIKSKVDFTMVPEHYIGRNAESEDLRAKMEMHHKVFVTGVGGNGKTIFVVKYAFDHQKEYSKILFVPVFENLTEAIANDSSFPISGISRTTNENEEEYAKRKIMAFNRIADLSVLLIIDGINNLEKEPLLGEVLRLVCKVILISRAEISVAGVPAVKIGSVSTDDAIKLYRTISEDFCSSDGDIKALLELADYHTLTIELLARQTAFSPLSVKEMTEKFASGGFKSISESDVVGVKDSTLTFDTIYGHIKKLYSISGFKPEEKEILYKIAIVSEAGIYREAFNNFGSKGVDSELNRLQFIGWLKYSTETRELTMHPVIADVVRRQCQEEGIYVDSFVGKCNLWMMKQFVWDQEITNKKLLLQKCLIKNYLFESADLRFTVTTNMAELLRQAGRYYEAVKYFETAAIYVEESKSSIDKRLICRYCNNQGLLWMEGFSNPQQALDWFEKALRSISEDDKVIEPVILCNLADCYCGLREDKKALGCCDKAIRIANEMEDIEQQTYMRATAYQKKGKIFQSIKDYNQAIDAYLKACNEAFESSDVNCSRIYLWSIRNMTKIALESGDYELALELAEKAVNYTQNVFNNDMDVVVTHKTVADIAFAMKDFDKAYSEYLKIIKIYKKRLVGTLSSIGGVFFNFAAVCWQTERYDEAVESIDSSVSAFASLDAYEDGEVAPFVRQNALMACLNAMYYHYMTEEVKEAKKYANMLLSASDELPDEQREVYKEIREKIDEKTD